MAAVTAVSVYCLLINFAKPIYVDSARMVGNITPSLYLNDKTSKYEGLNYKQTNHDMAKASFVYGTYTPAVTLVYPSLYKRITRRTKPPTRLTQSNALIIAICLMLSGDIHPCPGPPYRYVLQKHHSVFMYSMLIFYPLCARRTLLPSGLPGVPVAMWRSR